MGIKNLIKIIDMYAPNAKKEININTLKNKIIAIDSSIILYKYITAIRNHGKDLTTSKGISTSHIYGILSKAIQLIKLKIIPVFIFDNKNSELKDKELELRSKNKKKALSLLSVSTTAEENIKYLKQSVSISTEETNEAIEILHLLGVPVIVASEEADSQCAYLSRNNLVDYVISEDMDLLTFGTKKLIRNFFKKDMYVLSLENILEDSEITMEQFIDICILLGCDYSETIKGIGIKKAWQFIKEYNSIENILKNIDKKYEVPKNFRYKDARNYFLNLKYNDVDNNTFKLKKPNIKTLKKLLIEKYEFNKDKIDEMLSIFNDLF